MARQATSGFALEFPETTVKRTGHRPAWDCDWNVPESIKLLCCATIASRRPLNSRDLSALLLSGSALAGFAIMFWSRDLSVRCNTWTTRLREKYARVDAAPSPKMRALNVSIMTWVLRFVGAMLIAQAVVLIFAIRDLQP